MRKTLVLVSLVALLAGVFAATITSDNTVSGVTIVPKYDSSTGTWGDVTFTISGCTNVKWYTPTENGRHIHTIDVDVGNTFKWDGIDKYTGEPFEDVGEIRAMCDGEPVFFPVHIGTPFQLATTSVCSVNGGSSVAAIDNTNVMCNYPFKITDVKVEQQVTKRSYNVFFNTPFYLSTASISCDNNGGNTGWTSTPTTEHGFGITLPDVTGGADYTCTIAASYEDIVITKAFDVSTKTPAQPTCSDTDDVDQYTKGTVTADGIKYTDKCSYDAGTKKHTLTEYMCNTDGTYDTVVYDCPNGCANGACYTSSNMPDTTAPTKPVSISGKYESPGKLTIRCSGSTDARDSDLDYQFQAYQGNMWKNYANQGKGYVTIDSSGSSAATKIRCRANDDADNSSPWLEEVLDYGDLTITNVYKDLDFLSVEKGSKAEFTWKTNDFADSKVVCVGEHESYGSETYTDFTTEKVKSHKISFPQLQRGTYSCTITSKDSFGNTATEDVEEFDVLKNQAPVIDYLKVNAYRQNDLTEEAKLRGGQNPYFLISCKATDPDNNPVYYTIDVYDKSGWTTVINEGTTGYYSWDVGELPTQNGIRVRCKASDTLDETDWSEIKGLSIDNSGPSIDRFDYYEVNMFNNARVAFQASEPVTLWMLCDNDQPIQRNTPKTYHDITWRHTPPAQKVSGSQVGAGSDSLLDNVKKFNCKIEVQDAAANKAEKTITVEPNITNTGPATGIGGSSGGSSIGGFQSGTSGSFSGARFGFKSGGMFIDQNWLDIIQMILLAAVFVLIALGAKKSAQEVIM